METFVPINLPTREQTIQVAAIQPLKFWTEYREVLVSKPGEEPQQWKTVGREFVRTAKKGTTIPTATDFEVARVKKDASIWAAIKPYYDNWKAGGTDELINGTPLNSWGGVTRDEVEALKPFRIYSVEDFAEMNDAVMQRIPFPNISAKRDRAKKYLATKETADEVRGQLSEVLEEMKRLKAENEAMKLRNHAEAQIEEIRSAKPKGKKADREAVAA